MKNRFLTLFASLGLFLVSAFFQTQASDSKIGFHFYGANDCPPCMAFKRNYLSLVKASAQEHGYSLKVNIIGKIQDVSEKGSYGSADPLLRKAEPSLSFVYPPIFIVTVNGDVVMAKTGNWRKVMERAEQESS